MGRRAKIKTARAHAKKENNERDDESYSNTSATAKGAMGLTSADEQKAVALRNTGEQILAKFTTFNSNAKYQDACILFEKAARHYELVHMWNAAAVCYRKGATCRKRLKGASRAAAVFDQAAELYVRSQRIQHAIECWQESISLYAADGRFHVAAERALDIARHMKTRRQMGEAASYFLRAHEFFESGHMVIPSLQALREHARALVSNREYSGASEAFDMLSTRLLESDLLKFNMKDAVLWSVVCLLIETDCDEARAATKRALKLDPTFRYSKEEVLCAKLIEVVSSSDVDLYADIVYCYASMRELDTWELLTFKELRDVIVQGKEATEKAKAEEDERENFYEAMEKKLWKDTEKIQNAKNA